MSPAAPPPDRLLGARQPRRPPPKNAVVAAQMSRMPRSSTQPELLLRRALHARGLRFTVNRKDLPGTPDVVLSRARIAVFVDGCFWHACEAHGVVPKNNRSWWHEKLQANRERDHRKDQALRRAGWLPVHVWEHEAVPDAAEQIVRLWLERRDHQVRKG
jgi:DNA mismatch endonuclease (patch repair protein)